MFIHELLEDQSYDKYDVEPMFEEYITEDVSSLETICIDDAISISETAVGLVQLDQLALVNEEVLNEGTFKNIFDKIINAIKTTWAKIKAFFQRLFKSIQIMLVDVKKSLDNVDKYLSKDLSKFEYEGYVWKTSPTLYKTLATNCEAAIKSQKKKISVKETEEKYAMSEEQILGLVYSGNANGNGITMQKAQTEIKAKYRDGENKVTITGFNKGYSIKDMITFVKEFNKNEVLVNAQKDSNDKFKELLDLCEEAKNKAQEKVDKASEPGKDNSAVSGNLVKHCQVARSVVSKYNTLMSMLIGLEKQKFSDFRSVIAKAVRYNPKKEK